MEHFIISSVLVLASISVFYIKARGLTYREVRIKRRRH
jgi:hypothetical protein